MILYRISNQIYSQDISGKGAALFGGRWNSKGNHALYLSSHTSLAVLEILVNYNYEQLMHTAFDIVTFEIKNDKSVESIKNLESNWRYLPKYTKEIGDQFLMDKSKLMLKIPSAIIETEYNYLLNPEHIDFKKIKIINVSPLKLDNRLIKLV
jgi:RES domain-containing protein